MKIESLRRGSFGNAHKMIFPPRIFTNIVSTFNWCSENAYASYIG